MNLLKNSELHMNTLKRALGWIFHIFSTVPLILWWISVHHTTGDRVKWLTTCGRTHYIHNASKSQETIHNKSTNINLLLPIIIILSTFACATIHNLRRTSLAIVWIDAQTTLTVKFMSHVWTVRKMYDKIIVIFFVWLRLPLIFCVEFIEKRKMTRWRTRRKIQKKVKN